MRIELTSRYHPKRRQRTLQGVITFRGQTSRGLERNTCERREENFEDFLKNLCNFNFCNFAIIFTLGVLEEPLVFFHILQVFFNFLIRYTL